MTSPFLHALIVGIDRYGRSSQCSHLSHAVEDARNAQSFFENHLKVPPANISLLCNEAATRHRVMSTFRSHLIENARIQYGDPVVFYFAGYGSVTSRAPTGPQNTLCPTNRGRGVPDISYHELHLLTSELACVKGPNITVILDCCHSSDANSSSVEFDRKARHASPFQSTSTSRSVVSANESPDQASCDSASERYLTDATVIAACADGGRTWDNSAEINGRFSESLFVAFSAASFHDTSYRELITSVRDSYRRMSLGTEEQDLPVCYGSRRDCPIFDGMVLGDPKPLVPVHCMDERGIVVEAGRIHGVVPGTRLDIFENKAGVRIMGNLVAKDVQGLWCSAVHDHDGRSFVLPEHPYARIIFQSDTPFSFGMTSLVEAQRRAAESYVDAAFRDSVNTRGNTLVSRTRPEDAKLVASFDNMSMSLKRQDPLIGAHCVAQVEVSAISCRTSGELDYCKVIKLAAIFDLHLYRENGCHPYGDNIEVNLWALGIDSKPQGIGHIVDGRADLQHDPDVSYSLEIRNDNSLDLWCSIFYFDPSDYSIIQLYQSVPDTPSLESCRSFELGTIDGPGEAFYFYVAGEEEDTGFLKIFVSSSFVNLSMLEQNVQDEQACWKSAGAGHIAPEQGDWDTITIPIHVYRDTSSSRQRKS